MWTKRFWKQTAERSVKTFAQAAAAVLSADGLGLFDVAWTGVLSVALMAALLSVLMSIASAESNESDSPSLV